MSLPQTNENTLSKRALHVLIIIVVLGLGACIFYLGYVQLALGEEYRAKAEANQLRDSEISAERGVIYDRNGKELAKSASAWKIVIYPNRMADCKPAREIVISKLSEVLKISEDTVRAKAEMPQYGNMVVKSRVENDVREKVLNLLKKDCYEFTNKDGLKIKYKFSDFIGIENDVKRYYPYSTFASTVIGFTGTGDVGSAGLELEYNSILTGIPGRKITAVSGSGDSMPSEYETIVKQVRGTSLVTTLDETIQRYLEEAVAQSLKDTQAEYVCGIVMDVNTGAILAMTNKPDFDLNDPYKITSQTVKDHLDEITDERKKQEAESTAWFTQWKNKNVAETYEPGSVFKIITAAASLEENTWDLTKTYTCTGAIKVGIENMHCDHKAGCGTQNIAQAMAHSCNPYFINMGLVLGPEKFNKYFEAFGFAERSGVDLPAEQIGIHHSTELMEKINIHLGSSAFGQSFTITPLQMITAVSAIANGGKLLRPYIVSKTLDPDGNIISETKPVVRRQVISEKTADLITDMMVGVVSDEGTGRSAYLPGYRIAGKTGTSEILEDPNKLVRDHIASFTCFAPADEPEIALLIVIKKPVGRYYAGEIAVPVAADVMQKLMVYLNVEPKYTEKDKDFVERNAENVVGKKVEDAKQILSGSGFNVRVIGSGDKVVEQVPSSNQMISANGTVILYTEKGAEKQVTTVPDFTGMNINQVYAAANQAGVNVSIVGNAASSSFISYRQDKEANSKVYCGDTIVVYFKSITSEE